MKLTWKRKGLMLLLVIATVAVAKMWGPFNVSLRNPSIRSFADDSDLEFAGARNIARLYMLLDVQQIKRGDIVRVVYASGEVYDMDVTAQCSYVAGISCAFGKKTRVESIDSPSTVSQTAIKDWLLKHAPCEDRPGNSNTVQRDVKFPTGRWVTEYPQSSDPATIVVRGFWEYTGEVVVRLSVPIGGGGGGGDKGCKKESL
ncbi:hypothetical protein RQP53_21120 [Paucibacter sp. APW11]|uniref:Uncharacterized protein n=1 Tax=Roseateles aquae TaxID=3077235 RepID=A0ABU3PI47_9BURK|nr:hypothetical protein [Paucibacter sp. APW11]MDT9001792.1 hypothetical protein [Paucibacter sp. APW11]